MKWNGLSKYLPTAGLVVGLIMGLAWVAIEGDFPMTKASNRAKQGRIVFVERSNESYAPDLYLYQVDGVEYIVLQHGGIIKHENER